MTSVEKRALGQRLRDEMNRALYEPMSTEEEQGLFLLLTPCEQDSIN